MFKQITFCLVRHALSGLGGFVLARAYIFDGGFEAAVGFACLASGILWSVWHLTVPGVQVVIVG